MNWSKDHPDAFYVQDFSTHEHYQVDGTHPVHHTGRMMHGMQFAHDQHGVPMDVKMYSRLCAYAALGWCAACASPAAFQMLGLERG